MANMHINYLPTRPISNLVIYIGWNIHEKKINICERHTNANFNYQQENCSPLAVHPKINNKCIKCSWLNERIFGWTTKRMNKQGSSMPPLGLVFSRWGVEHIMWCIHIRLRACIRLDVDSRNISRFHVTIRRLYALRKKTFIMQIN